MEAGNTCIYGAIVLQMVSKASAYLYLSEPLPIVDVQ